jgi:tetratricopeptide (TPR) repeat protein
VAVDIFLSYASEQRALAEEIALALRGEGHEVFFDRSELPEGEAYNARIREAIEASDLLVFLVSPEAVAEGRYTLTELRFAEGKWRSPTGRVLPVMVRPTDGAALPAYLRAVVILRPAGNVPAEVVAAVHRLLRPRWMRWLRRYGLALGVVALVGTGVGIWRAVETWRACGQALGLVAEAKLHQSAGDYAAAWDRYASGLAACPSSREAAQGQERLAMDWLENIRVTQGKETFTDIADKVQPALSRAAVARDDQRAADALAHLGWADFLRSRDGRGGLDPIRYYRQAFERDPDNAYAHAFLGHAILVRDGDLQEAKEHFDRALADRTHLSFLRGLQLAALMWHSRPDLQDEIVKVANQMRVHGEGLPAVGSESLVSAIWNVYYVRLVRSDGREAFLAALPAADHLATFEWLFPRYADSSNRHAYLVMLAQLQENNGARADALETYRTVLAILSAQGADSGTVFNAARQAVQRLHSK